MTTAETASNGRRSDGTFAVGNSAASGHRRRKLMAELRFAFTNAISTEDVSAIVATVVRLAKDGDSGAAKLVLDRALGKLTALDSEDLPPDAPLSISEQIAALGPVTADNLAEHKRLRILDLRSCNF